MTSQAETVDFSNLFAGSLDALRALEDHRRTCADVPCARCDRYACPRCRKQAPEEDRPCVECLLDDGIAEARASVPKRFRWALDASPEVIGQRVRGVGVKGALTWAAAPTTGSLVLTGLAGVGKTSLAVAMLGRWLAAHRDPAARFAESFALALERMRHPLGQGEAPAIDRAMRASLLVLDDLGSEQPGRSDAIADVLFARHNADLPTWVTTGLSRQDVESRYGAGVGRRVYDGSRLVQLGATAGEGTRGG